jgi:membrane protein implicated in regulation of membrane protease activity
MRDPREPRLWLMDGIFLFVLVLWTSQLFLLITGLDAYLGGQKNILWPAAITSVVLALINVWLVRFTSGKRR